MHSLLRTLPRPSRGVHAVFFACALSCAPAEHDVSARVNELTQPQRLDDKVWITTARDSVRLVERVLGAPPPLRDEHLVQRPSDEVALLVPRASLADISAAQHQEHHRCGGFMLQESEAEAMAVLHAERPAQLVAPAYTLDNQSTVKALLPELQEANVLASIRKLSSYRTRFHTSTTGEEAALYIRDSWKAIAGGRDDIEVALVEHQKTPQPSVRMTIRGSTLAEQWVVLGGHLDSISGRGNNTSVAPGADDNASGIASLTEIARAAVALDYRPERSVVFYGYAAEEIGLVGSAEIAAQAKAEGLDVYGVMQLDMTNYTTAPTPYIGLVTDFTDASLNSFSQQLIETYLDVPYKLFECGYGCSDHASWDKQGFPAVAPHEADMEESNQRIHTANDTLALSKDSAAHSMHFVRFGVAFMAELAKGKLAVAEPVASSDAGAPGDVAIDACTTSMDCTDAAAAGEPDAGPPERDAGRRDAGRRDAGSPAPTSSPIADTAGLDESNEPVEPSTGDDDEPPPASKPAGCSVPGAGAARGSWLPGLLVTLLLLAKRSRRYG